MLKKMRGFTLIELLIVVAIIGILAALLIPNALSAIQKAKQKGTMKDINSIATAMIDYVTDKGTAPVFSPASLQANDAIGQALSGFYLKVLPINDQWGSAFMVGCGPAADDMYQGVSDCGLDDFVIASYGRTGVQEDIPFVVTDPATAYFDITGMLSFNRDLVNWSGSWISVPKSAQLGTT